MNSKKRAIMTHLNFPATALIFKHGLDCITPSYSTARRFCSAHTPKKSPPQKFFKKVLVEVPREGMVRGFSPTRAGSPE
jgi:hypothetical protein